MAGSDPRLVLASASPRRAELLRLAGFDPVVRAADIDERPWTGENPTDYVARLARLKAHAVARSGEEVVLAADTAVVLEAEPLGKPADSAHAIAMLRRLAGRAHTVSTGVAVVGPHDHRAEQTVTTEVVLADLSDAEIAAYVASGEPLGKAGGYAIQGRAAVLVERLCGSWTNVVGLPVVESLELLRHAGVTVDRT